VSVLSGASLHGREIAARLAALASRRPRIAYAGAHGAMNLGDDAIHVAARRLLPDRALLPYVFPAHERRLALLGLSGPRYFSQFVLGGGTLLNGYGIGIAEAAVRQGLPAWTLGTGVGSGGLGMPVEPDLGAWPVLLRRFVGIGVRGPRSRAALEALGVDRVEIVGDAALALAADEVTAPALPRRFAVNVTLPSAPGHVHGFPPERLAGIERAVAELAAGGWTPVFVAMHPHDLAPLRALAARVGRARDPVLLARSVAGFASAVGPCTFTLALRLHAAVLSACLGVPPLSVGYRDKCRDFMESMALERWHVALEDAGSTPDVAGALAAQADALRAPVLARAQVHRDRLRAYVARCLAGER
jgi:hypothetical protein